MVKYNIHVDRPNRFNTTPYTPAEFDDFANTRRQIENAATTLGYTISHQSGVSLYGVQIDLMHPPATTAQQAVQPITSAPVAGPGVSVITAAQSGATSNASGGTTGLATVAPPADAPLESSESDGDPPAIPNVQQVHGGPKKYLEMIHHYSLKRSLVVNSFVARSASVSEVFRKSGMRGVFLSRDDTQAYERGGDVLRVHFEDSGYTDRYFAHVMVCDVGACTAECSAIKEPSRPREFGTGGEHFVHAVRDCTLTSEDLLTFDPEEHPNLNSFSTVLPEVVHGVAVTFRNTRQQDISVTQQFVNGTPARSART